MNENQLDLSLFHDFPPQLSEHTVPKLRMTDHGELVMNPAMKNVSALDAIFWAN